MKKTKKISLFLIAASALTAAAVLFVFATKGLAFRYITWNSDTGGIFPDLFESIGDAHKLRPYDGKSIYPAFAYLICYLLSRFIPIEATVWKSDTLEWQEYSLSAPGIIVSTVFFAMTTAAVCRLMSRRMNLSNSNAIILTGVFIMSPAFLFMLERGNIVILTLLFLLVFISFYDSDDRVLHEAALICLAFAAAMKIYPALFGLLLLKEKRIIDAVKCLLYGLAAFVLPFTVMGGVKCIATMIHNISVLSSESDSTGRGFGYGYKINVSNIINALCDEYSGRSAATDALCTAGIVAIVILALTVVLLSEKRWQRFFAITAIMILVPSFSWIYNAIYLVIPLIFFVTDDEYITNKRDIAYCLLFVSAFALLPYGAVFEYLAGANKVTYSTLSVNFSTVAMLLMMFVESIYSRCSAVDKSKDLNRYSARRRRL